MVAPTAPKVRHPLSSRTIARTAEADTGPFVGAALLPQRPAEELAEELAEESDVVVESLVRVGGHQPECGVRASGGREGEAGVAGFAKNRGRAPAG